ncbi:MAG: PadR family transcriptional regulator [Saprospiraceae bacterium]|nr:PadR family transcriptional regulator [Saprospiraceae bacterium]
MKTDNTKAQMRKGVLEMCVLSMISTGEKYPSELLDQLKTADLLVVEGTLYPLLNRLKDAGYLEYEWRESNAGPPRKYYRITPEGETMAVALRQAWSELVQSVQITLENPTIHE